MAINKVVNRKTSSHGAMKNCIKYVLQDQKVKEGYVEITGPFDADFINPNDIYQSWLKEKRLWNKDRGRMYAHNIISFHKDEDVTPEQVLEIGKLFCNRFFPAHQCVIGVHQDKDHLHCHIVTNSVSYLDGHKLHQKKHDLQLQKDFTNELCLEQGLTIAKKGFHFNGTPIETGEVITWSKDSYNLFRNNSKKSYIADCVLSILDTLPESTDKTTFISGMHNHGWNVKWDDSHKHIVFINDKGNKVRDTTINKNITLNININKEDLENEFNKQLRHKKEREQRDSKLQQYYSEVESVISGESPRETISGNKKTEWTKAKPRNQSR